jgi:hypothetical protein
MTAIEFRSAALMKRIGNFMRPLTVPKAAEPLVADEFAG